MRLLESGGTRVCRRILWAILGLGLGLRLERTDKLVRRNLVVALVTSGLLLTLVGCVNDGPLTPKATPGTASSVARDSGEPSKGPGWPRPIPAGDTLWFVTSENAVGKFSLPSDPDEWTEELRKQVGAAPLAYTTVAVDNRNGKTGVDMYELTAYDAGGRKYTFKAIDRYIRDWTRNKDYDAAARNPLSRPGDRRKTFANAGEVKLFVLATESTDLPEEFTRVSVKAHGPSDEVQAYPPADSAYINLDFEDVATRR